MRQRRFSLIVVIFAALVFTSCKGTQYGGTSSATTINILGMLGSGSFGTNPLHVAVGTQVVFHNSDSVTHTATSTSGPAAFDTGNLAPGATSSAITFNTAGTYNYDCSIHTTMTGQIIVP